MRPCETPFPRPVRRLLPGEAKSAPLRLYSTSTDGLCMVVVVHAGVQTCKLDSACPSAAVPHPLAGRWAQSLGSDRPGRFWAGLAGASAWLPAIHTTRRGDDQIVIWTGESGVSIGEGVVGTAPPAQ